VKLQTAVRNGPSKYVERVRDPESATQLRSWIFGERMKGYIVDCLEQ
jgi:hypothetical protein